MTLAPGRLVLLTGLLHRWELPAGWRTGMWLLGVGAVVAVVGLLASPVSWSHHYVWVAVLVLLVAAFGPRVAARDADRAVQSVTGG